MNDAIEKVLQWKFTSCLYNIEKANGFKTFSMSDGLTADDKDELIRRAGNYTCPDHLPNRPTPEEMRLFPVAFSSFRLRSGKRAAVRTCYVGKDYAGVRWGNFFSHALILPNAADQWPFHPIQLWESPLFARGLSPEEQNLGRTPDPLPPLDVDDADLHDWENGINAFFRDKDRQERLKSLIDAVGRRHETGNPAMLRDLRENIPIWIAAVQYAFPHTLSREINFSTYVYSDEYARLYDCAATVEGTDMQFPPSKVRTSLHLFDMRADHFPPSSGSSLYTRYISFEPTSYPGKIRSVFKDIEINIDTPFGSGLDKTLPLIAFFRDPNRTALNPASLEYLEECSDPFLEYGLKKLTHPPRRVTDLPTRDRLLAVLFRTCVKKGDVNALFDSFFQFFAHQYSVPLRELETEGTDFFLDGERFSETHLLELFHSLEEFFDASHEEQRRWGESLLSRLSNGQAVSGGFKSGDSSLIFLELSLILILEEDFSEEIVRVNSHVLNNLPEDQKIAFLIRFLPCMIEKCDKPEKHETVINLFVDQSSRQNGNPVKDYAVLDRHQILRNYSASVYRTACEHNPWHRGESAGIQATAFMKYLLQLDDKNEIVAYMNGKTDGKDAPQTDRPIDILFCLTSLRNEPSGKSVIIKRTKKQIYNVLLRDAGKSDGAMNRMNMFLERRQWKKKKQDVAKSSSDKSSITIWNCIMYAAIILAALSAIIVCLYILTKQ